MNKAYEELQKNIINFGNDSLDRWDLTKGGYEEEPVARIEFDTMLVNYNTYDYEGGGTAIWRKDGLWKYTTLGHCSCNGPLDYYESADEHGMTLEEVLKVVEIHFDECYSEEEKIGYEKMINYIKKSLK